MKKLLSVLLTAALCLGLAACGGPIDTVAATDEQKTAVIEAAKACFASEAYQTAVALYEQTTGEKAGAPEILTALTHRYDDHQGYTVDAVFFNVKTNVAITDATGEVTGFYDKVQFAVDNSTGKVYDSLTWQDWLNNTDGTISSAEDALLLCLNSPVVIEGKNTILYSEAETTTFFEKADLNEINAAVNG